MVPTAATESRYRERALRLLVVAAHPDDETIGCGALLAGLGDIAKAYIVHVTDGAPRDRRFVPSHITNSRGAYAQIRREELIRALELAGIGKGRLFSLGAVDQEACSELVRLSRALVELLHELEIDIVVSHPYEGGHPDHDAACFITHMACALVAKNALSTAPILVEMSSYHAAPGYLVTGQFLQPGKRADAVQHSRVPMVLRELCAKGQNTKIVELVCSQEARAHKAEMMGCFESQREILLPFGVDSERFRPAPSYDFSCPPHEGLLYYERLGWPIGGSDFRQRAQKAQEALYEEVGGC